jgi:hypothetical protein
MAEKSYVILAPFAGQHTRGDVVAEADLPGPAKDMVAEKSARPATAAEVKAGKVSIFALHAESPLPEPEPPPLAVEYNKEGDADSGFIVVAKPSKEAEARGEEPAPVSGSPVEAPEGDAPADTGSESGGSATSTTSKKRK